MSMQPDKGKSHPAAKPASHPAAKPGTNPAAKPGVTPAKPSRQTKPGDKKH